MPAADFADAQRRIAARRQARDEAERARSAALNSSNNGRSTTLHRLGADARRLWDVVKTPEGTRPSFRVGQVDAELLDEELLELLKSQVGEALKYFDSHLQDDWSAEILLVLRAMLFKLTIWDHNASYGAALQGLRYTDARDQSAARPAPKRLQKALYGIVTVGGRYAWTKWEDWLVSRSDRYDVPPETARLVALADRVTTSLSTIHSATALASFLVFLVNGKYRTILDRILRLRLVSTAATTSREVSFEYLNRQLVWHAFTEFLLFLLPLVGISRWRRLLNRTWRRIVTFFTRRKRSTGETDDEDTEAAQEKAGEFAFLPERTCAICYSGQNIADPGGAEAGMAASSGIVGSASTDITNPYEATPCGCIYCFVCLAQKIDAEEGEGWTCLRCAEVVKSCKPWNGDVLEEVKAKGFSDSSNGKSVGFAEDAEIVGGSIGERYGLQEVEPLPEEDEKAAEVSQDVEQDVDKPESPELASRMLDDSEEWARTSRMTADTADEEEEEDDVTEQSVDYDEEDD